MKKEREEEDRKRKPRRSLSSRTLPFLFSMLRRRPSQVPLGAASEAQRALLAEASPSSAGGRSYSRKKRLALGVAAALAAATLFAVGVVLGVSSSTSTSGSSDHGGIAASARLLLKEKIFSGVANDARRPPGAPRKLGSGVAVASKGADSRPIRAALTTRATMAQSRPTSSSTPTWTPGGEFS